MTNTSEPIVNRVQASGIRSIDMEDFAQPEELAVLDLASYLHHGLILKEKEFRQSLKELDLTPYTGKYTAIYCSTDAILPGWATMLTSSVLTSSKAVFSCTPSQLRSEAILYYINNEFDTSPYVDARIVVKGCGDGSVNDSCYVALLRKLQPVARSIMYGEPCSTVPIYKKKS